MGRAHGWSVGVLLLIVPLLVIGCGDEGSESPGDQGGDTEEVVELPKDSTEIPYKTPEGGPARFAFRSGTVEMEYIGMLNGHRKIWFDQYGLRERTFDSAYPARPPIPLLPPYSMMIMTPTSVAMIDLRGGTGNYGPNKTIDSYMNEWRQGKRPLGELALDKSGAERLPDTLLLDTWPCRVYRQVGSGMTRTMYVHGGVPIGEAVTFRGDDRTGYRVLPTSVTFNRPVADSLFLQPEGYDMKPFE